MAEINAFYDWQEANPLTASAINLWHALMSIANKAGWPENFSTTMSTLESRTRYGRDTIYSARNQLKQAGRIDFKERRGRQSTLYKIVPLVSGKPTQPFVSDSPTQPPTQPPTQVPTQPPTQVPTINRLYYTTPDEEFFDGDDLKAGEIARASSEVLESSGKPNTCRIEAVQFASRLFSHYFGRSPTEHDVQLLLDWIQRGEIQSDGSFHHHIDHDRSGVVEYAFQIAAEDGVHSWRYVRQVLSNLAARGLKTREACEEYDAQREFDKDNRK